MALNRVDLGIQYFPQFAADRAIANAQIYIGQPNLDPQVVANQIQAYVVQENGTQVPVPQPIRTGAGGVPTYNGSPVQVAVDAIDYSVKALTSTGSQIYYVPSTAALAAFSTNASAVIYDPAGTGAIATTQAAYNARNVYVDDFGADPTGAVDSWSAFDLAIDYLVSLGGGTLRLSRTGVTGGYLISQAVIIPERIRLEGEGRTCTLIRLSGNHDGLVMNRNCSVRQLRVIAHSTSTNATACIWTGGLSDAYNSDIQDVVVGGLVTTLGDSTNLQVGAVGIQGGNVFWLYVNNVMATNCDIGYQNTLDATRGTIFANNAILFNQFKSISNRIGVRISQVNNVVFAQPSFTSSDEYGLVCGNVRTLVIQGAHLESNNRINNANPIKADILVQPSAVGETASGTSLSLENCRVSAGSFTQTSIYIDGQFNFSIDGGSVRDASTNGIVVTNNVQNTGNIRNINRSGLPIINNSPFVSVEDNGVRRTYSGTVTVDPLGYQILFALGATENYDVAVNQSPPTSARYLVAQAFCPSAGAVTTTTVKNAGGLIITDPLNTASWVTATVYAANAVVKNGTNMYYTAAGGTSGATPPTHTSGTVSDGGVSWTYISTTSQVAVYNSSGVARIFTWLCNRFI